MRILVAEDDAPLAKFLHERLQQEQFAVQVVSDGREAQRLAADQPYDLVILDLNLPGLGGLDVLRGIRSPLRSWRRASVLFCGGDRGPLRLCSRSMISWSIA